jgi:hypothetical protein
MISLAPESCSGVSMTAGSAVADRRYSKPYGDIYGDGGGIDSDFCQRLVDYAVAKGWVKRGSNRSLSDGEINAIIRNRPI